MGLSLTKVSWKNGKKLLGGYWNKMIDGYENNGITILGNSLVEYISENEKKFTYAEILRQDGFNIDTCDEYWRPASIVLNIIARLQDLKSKNKLSNIIILHIGICDSISRKVLLFKDKMNRLFKEIKSLQCSKEIRKEYEILYRSFISAIGPRNKGKNKNKITCQFVSSSRFKKHCLMLKEELLKLENHLIIIVGISLKQDDYRMIYKDVLAVHEEVLNCKPFVYIPLFSEEYDEYCGSDGVHLNNIGHEYVAKEIEKIICDRGWANNIKIKHFCDDEIKISTKVYIKKYEEIASFSQEQVNKFSELSGDYNCFHTSDQKSYWKFDGPIVHGALIVGKFSKIFATNLPGPGSVYLSQNINFKFPLYVGRKAKFIVEKIKEHNRINTLKIICVDEETGKEICSGEAVILETALTKRNIIDGFKTVGLCAGDAVLVHSYFKSFGCVEGGPQTVVDALLEVLGPQGTLIIPTFSFDFIKYKVYNKLETKSEMGRITECVRTNPKATHIYHPIYSFAILGRLSEQLAKINNISSYGEDSMFGELKRIDGKIFTLGLRYNNSMTFFHHIEEVVGCDYRYMKEFSGQVIDLDGSIKDTKCTMFVRDIDAGVITTVDPMGELLEEMGIIKKHKIGPCNIRLMKAKEVFEATKDIPKLRPELLRQIIRK